MAAAVSAISTFCLLSSGCGTPVAGVVFAGDGLAIAIESAEELVVGCCEVVGWACVRASGFV